METETTIRKGVELGSGGFAHVFRAVQSDTQRVVALKQSRVSRQLKRPPLQHEAKVLKLLSGHPGVPEIYAYGRIDHFELISMQLLHRSLRDVVQEDGPLGVKTVANMADQMMRSNTFIPMDLSTAISSQTISIMLQSPGSWKLCLIDFGLAHRLPSLVASTTSTTLADSGPVPDRTAHVFGTLPFASLNAHEKNPQLAFRDDLESLAYTLLWLLRGSLPWSHYASNGNRVGRTRQVHAQKKRHTGSTLGTELPVEFGELVDYARLLSVDEKPDYDEWRRRFKQVEAPAAGNDASMSRPKTPDPQGKAL
ncbi:hypothetical protein RSAG8_11342, partial [Rhizoctonia solani AG-8 WAC10335]